MPEGPRVIVTAVIVLAYFAAIFGILGYLTQGL